MTFPLNLPTFSKNQPFLKAGTVFPQMKYLNIISINLTGRGHGV